MLEILKKIGHAIFVAFSVAGMLFACIYVVIIFFKTLFTGQAAPDVVAPGKHLLWLTWAMSIGFIVWQYFSVKKDFKEPSVILGIMVWIAFIIGGTGVIGRMLAFYDIDFLSNGLSYLVALFDSEMGESMRTQPGTPGAEKYIITQILQSLFVGAIIFGTVFGTLYIFFRIGIVTSGLAFSVAFHNWVNGLTFDMSVMYNLFMETTLSEFWGTVVAITQFLVTIGINKWLGGSMVDGLEG